MADKVVLAYSGGVDTSVAIRWLHEKYGLDVVAVTIDVGNEKDFAAVRQKALKVGAIKAIVIDAKDDFVNQYVWPALKADAIYEDQYPLATALGRDWKGKGSLVVYAIAVPPCFVQARLSITIYALVALMWFVPNRRIERTLIGHDA